MAGTQAVGAPSPQEVTASSGRRLWTTRCFGLRLAAARTPAETATIQVGVPTKVPPKPMGPGLVSDSRGTWPSKEDGLREPPAGGVSLTRLQEAADRLATDLNASTVLNRAAQAIGNTDDPALVQPTARAVVAYALATERGELGRGPDALFLANLRDTLARQVERALSGGVQGGFDWLGQLRTRFAES